MRRLAVAVLGVTVLAFGPAGCGKTTKTGLTVGLKTHKDRTFGFEVRYPNKWRRLRASDRRTRLVVGNRRGASCNVMIQRARLRADKSGRPRKLNRYLKAFTKRRLARGYPKSYRARITEFRDVDFGGQKAKRIVVHMRIKGRKPISAVQYVTWRNYGVVTLNCGAPSAQFRTAGTRRDFDNVALSFRF